jgi:flavodoxin
MPRYLVVYYSWTGNTGKVARLIAERLSADVEHIQDIQPRGGPFAFPAALTASVLKRSPPIRPLTKSVADYDVVILGCPVWASNMATPMRTYIARESTRIKKAAVFCTLGGSGGKTTLHQMAALCGRTPLAELIVNQPAMASDGWRDLTETFVRKVEAGQALKSGAPSPGFAAA